MITINARGARTIADARPLTFEGTQVYITTDGDTAQLHLAGRIADERPATEINSTKDAQDWAYSVIEATDAKSTTVEIDYFRKGRKAGFFKETITVETVTIEELKDGDEVVYHGSEFTTLGQVASVFRTSYADLDGKTHYGPFRLVIGGTPQMVLPGATFQRKIG